jgi:hypothetical protein
MLRAGTAGEHGFEVVGDDLFMSAKTFSATSFWRAR